MNRAEARRIAGKFAAELLELDHDRLLAAYGDRPRSRVVFGQDGVTYQVEIRVEPEASRGRDLRVTVTVDDGGHDPAGPVVDDFVTDCGGRLASGYCSA